MVSALYFQAGYREFESRSSRDNFQTFSTPSSCSMCPGLRAALGDRQWHQVCMGDP